MATISLGVLGVIGALLAVTGIFGMAADSVSKRLRELGIRTALGAQRKEVLQAALGRAFKLLAFVSPQDCCWEFWPAARSRPSCMTQRHATRSFWLALLRLCFCWDCWRHESRRAERWRSIPQYCSARSEPAGLNISPRFFLVSVGLRATPKLLVVRRISTKKRVVFTDSIPLA